MSNLSSGDPWKGNNWLQVKKIHVHKFMSRSDLSRTDCSRLDRSLSFWRPLYLHKVRTPGISLTCNVHCTEQHQLEILFLHLLLMVTMCCCFFLACVTRPSLGPGGHDTQQMVHWPPIRPPQPRLSPKRQSILLRKGPNRMCSQAPSNYAKLEFQDSKTLIFYIFNILDSSLYS